MNLRELRASWQNSKFGSPKYVSVMEKLKDSYSLEYGRLPQKNELYVWLHKISQSLGQPSCPVL